MGAGQSITEKAAYYEALLETERAKVAALERVIKALAQDKARELEEKINNLERSLSTCQPIIKALEEYREMPPHADPPKLIQDTHMYPFYTTWVDNSGNVQHGWANLSYNERNAAIENHLKSYKDNTSDGPNQQELERCKDLLSKIT